MKARERERAGLGFGPTGGRGGQATGFETGAAGAAGGEPGSDRQSLQGAAASRDFSDPPRSMRFNPAETMRLPVGGRYKEFGGRRGQAAFDFEEVGSRGSRESERGLGGLGGESRAAEAARRSTQHRSAPEPERGGVRKKYQVRPSFAMIMLIPIFLSQSICFCLSVSLYLSVGSALYRFKEASERVFFPSSHCVRLTLSKLDFRTCWNTSRRRRI